MRRAEGGRGRAEEGQRKGRKGRHGHMRGEGRVVHVGMRNDRREEVDERGGVCQWSPRSAFNANHRSQVHLFQAGWLIEEIAESDWSCEIGREPTREGY